MGKIAVFFSLLFLTVVLLLTPELRGQSARDLKNEDDLVRKEMIQISKELGVTCTECHNAKNFRDDSKPSFRIAAEHMKLVTLLRSNGLDGKKAPEANCYMCHRGGLKVPTEASRK